MIEQRKDRETVSLVRSLLAPYLTPNGLQAFRNLSALVIATAIAQVCGLISVLLLTRSLGAEGYGIFAFALTIQNYLMILGSAGLRPIIVREMIRRPESLNRLWTAYVTITGGFGILLAVLTIATAAFLAPTPSEQIVLTLIAIGNIAACLSPLPFYDYRHSQLRSAVIMTGTELTALGILSGLYISNNLSLTAAAFVFTAKWIGSAVWMWSALQRDLPEMQWSWSKLEPVRLLSSSWKLIVSALLGTIPLTAGILLVRFYHGDTAAGIFGVAMYAPRALLMLVGQFIRVLLPHIMGEYGFRREFLARLLVVYLSFIGLTVLGGIAGLALVITYLLPPEFSPALYCGVIMLIGAAFLAIAMLCVNYLIAMHRERRVVAVYSVTALSYFIAAHVLIPNQSIIGAAWATVFSGVVMLILSGISSFHVDIENHKSNY